MQQAASELDRIFSGEINFIFGSSKPGSFPDSSLPEIAIIGKSNVGKSSLINALTSRKSLARVSHTPGRTQQINFFKVRDMFLLVDLPGYGYAKVSKSQHANWEKMILRYFERRETLTLVLLLVDSRHGLKQNDIDVADLLDSLGIHYWIVFTKSDKMPLAMKEELTSSIEKLIGHNASRVFFASSRERGLLTELKIGIFEHITSDYSIKIPTTKQIL